MAGNQPDDNILGGAPDGQSVGGSPMGLILQQLKIITLILREGFNLEYDEDATFLAQPQPTLNPPATNNPQNL